MVKTFAEKNYSKPAPIDDSVVIELDEMWHFLCSKKDEFGLGKPTAEPQNSPSVGNVAHERLNLSKDVRAIEKVEGQGVFLANDAVFVVILYK